MWSNTYASFFYVDGFRYMENHSSGNRSVTLYDIPYKQEVVIIPSKVTYEGITYTVNKIELSLRHRPSDNHYRNISILKIPESIEDIQLNGMYTGGRDDVSYFLGEWLTNLESIIVDEYNLRYKSINGVLYTKDGKQLLMCPCKNTSNEVLTTVEEISENAFYHSILKRVLLPESIKKIGKRAFFGSSLESIKIPDGITKIEDETFAYANLEKIELPPSLTKIGNEAFKYCQLKEINFPATLNTIGSFAFEYNKFTTLNFPKSISSIGEKAFRECRLIEKIFCQWDVPIPTTPTIFPDNVISSATLYVPYGSKTAYERALDSCWGNFWNIEEYDNSGIENVIIDNETDRYRIYDLYGRIVKEPISNCLYIINGKKIVWK